MLKKLFSTKLLFIYSFIFLLLTISSKSYWAYTFLQIFLMSYLFSIKDKVKREYKPLWIIFLIFVLSFICAMIELKLGFR